MKGNWISQSSLGKRTSRIYVCGGVVYWLTELEALKFQRLSGGWRVREPDSCTVQEAKASTWEKGQCNPSQDQQSESSLESFWYKSLFKSWGTKSDVHGSSSRDRDIHLLEKGITSCSSPAQLGWCGPHSARDFPAQSIDMPVFSGNLVVDTPLPFL